MKGRWIENEGVNVGMKLEALIRWMLEVDQSSRFCIAKQWNRGLRVARWIWRCRSVRLLALTEPLFEGLHARIRLSQRMANACVCLFLCLLYAYSLLRLPSHIGTTRSMLKIRRGAAELNRAI
jgi:hypothetical protein